MAGWYELSQASDGQFRFVLKAGNGEVILTSELYKAKASAHNGIESVQKNSSDDSRYERLEAKNGKPYFLVRADGTDANFIRSDQPDMLIPSWKIFEW